MSTERPVNGPCRAAAPNVAVKISGLGEAGRPWALDRNRDIILATVEMFGEDRCMFASNFPVDSLVGSFKTIYAGFMAATAPLGREAHRKLLADNARRIYRIPEPVSASEREVRHA